jgi:signal transduction histidine kinase
MSQIFAPLLPEYTINKPEDVFALVAWGVLFGLLIFLAFRLRDKSQKIDRSALIWMAVLSVLVLLLTPFFGMPIVIDSAFPFDQNSVPHLMFFAAVPWLIAGGMIGVLPAVLLAVMSGVLFAYLDTHHIFTPLVFMSLALVFSWSIRQRYRSRFYQLLRFPIIAVLVALVITTPLIFLIEILTLTGEIPLRIAIALNRMPSIWLAFGGMLLMGGLICVLVCTIFPRKWGGSKSLIPAPGEQSVKARFLSRSLPIFLVIMIALFGLVWTLNVNKARQEMVDNLIETSNIAAETWSVFIDTGLRAIDDLGSLVELNGLDKTKSSQLLTNKVRENTFFNHLLITSVDGKIIGSYSASKTEVLPFDFDEVFKLMQSLEDGGLWVLGIAPESENDLPQVIFLRDLQDKSGQTRQILWGQTSLPMNPFTDALRTVFAPLEENNGWGQIIDTSGNPLFSTESVRPLQGFAGLITTSPTYSETTTYAGDVLSQYFYPIDGSEWAVATVLPASGIYNSAWEFSYPIFLIGIGVLAVSFVFGLSLLSPVLKDINLLSSEMKKVTDGNYHLEHFESRSKGEVTHLVEEFHSLTNVLGGKIQKQRDLLSLSDAVLNQDNLHESLRTIMNAALVKGVSSVRVVLNTNFSGLNFDFNGSEFSLGERADMHAHLDEEILAFVQSKGELVFRDFQIRKSFTHKKGMSYPSALIAIPLAWQGKDLGAFWVAWDSQRSLNGDDIDFMRSLSHQAGIVIGKARTYDKAVLLRNRLETVLDDLSDGILLLNSADQVIYHNMAVRSMLGVAQDQIANIRITDLIKNQQLTNFVMNSGLSDEVMDFPTADGKISRILVSPIDFENGERGKSVIFKDITQTWEQDRMKSEFVTTASHELRSPLTLIHGYAKLLRLTGNLNEQQDSYIHNIIEGVEEMKELVQNLLDLGRLESGDALEIKRTSTTDLAKTVIESMQPYAKQKNIHLELSLPDAPITMDVDPIFLVQALKNLIENAIKFTKMGGEVTFAVRKNEGSIVFAVKDTGIGIAPLDQRHLFEKFNRVGTNLGRESTGSGLGLAIVKSIAERHGGKVWFESQLGRGSTFYLEIPQRKTKSVKM